MAMEPVTLSVSGQTTPRAVWKVPLAYKTNHNTRLYLSIDDYYSLPYRG